jgi:hypothetical protein
MNLNRTELVALSQLSEPEEARLKAISEWPLEKIAERVAAKLNWSLKYSQSVECEYRKFIFISAVRPSSGYGMAGPVDQFWHQHILDTRDYLAMCQVVAGQFIHHVPTEDKLKGTMQNNAYGLTLSDLKTFFGEASFEIWPQISTACRACIGCKAVIEGDESFTRVAA